MNDRPAPPNRREFLGTAGGLIAAGALGGGKVEAAARGAEPALVAHWPLKGDARDATGHGHHAENRGADLGAPGPGGEKSTAARFDGRGAFLEVPAGRAPRLGAGDFTLALRVHTEGSLDGLLGDIAARFDPAGRVGWSLGFSHSACTTSAANGRQLAFGIDRGSAPEWSDCGRPGRSVYTQALAVFDGRLYAGTCEPGGGESGHVYSYEGESNWSDCGSPDPCNAVAGLAEFDGRLYAGVSRYRLAGSSLTESSNPALGGKVYRHEGGKEWADCGKLGDAEAVGGMVVYKGELYASSTYSPGVFRYEGGTRWAPCGSGPGGKRVVALGVFQGHLYGTSYDGGRVYRYEGGADWSFAGEIPGATQTYGFASYEGNWYVSTWPKAEVWRFEGGDRWENCGRLGDELEVMGLAVYNGKMYGGTLPLARVDRYEGGTAWAPTGRVDLTPDVKYRRAWTFAQFDGRLFCGTLPSGRVHALKAGDCVTYDRAAAPGWRHVAAVRRGATLELYLDGAPAARADAGTLAGAGLDADAPLRLGAGPRSGLLGSLADVRLYSGALDPGAVRRLAD